MNRKLSAKLLIIISIFTQISCKDSGINPVENDPSNWYRQISGVNNNLKSVYFVDENTGYIVGSGFPSDTGKILKTFNGGASWSARYTPIPSTSLNGVHFLNSFIGFTVGAATTGSIIMATNDGANTWVTVPSPTSNILNALTFLNSTTGIACGANGTIIRTINGGTSWVNSNTSTSQELYGIIRTGNTQCFVSGAGGTVLYTNDGGSFWFSQNTGTSYNLYAIDFPNEFTGYAVGQSGTIIKTTDRGRQQGPGGDNGGQRVVCSVVFHGDSLSLFSFVALHQSRSRVVLGTAD
jgi:photosystem II stability/assembly factor-like uncharacterized protein